MAAITDTAPARVGLLGNPSDGYGGCVLGYAIADFGARATLLPADRIILQPAAAERCAARDLAELTAARRDGGLTGGTALLAAAIEELAAHHPAMAARLDGSSGLALSFATDVPRQSGLAGSSAIVIAAMRVLARHFELQLPAPRLADLALRAERDRLGIAAGPQDRVVQAHGGFLHMDFGAGTVEALDPALLPPTFLAFGDQPGESSGVVHDDVRARFERGDRTVVAAMQKFAQLARAGAGLLATADRAAFCDLVDANFDTRATIWTLSSADLEMVALGRRAGAAVKLPGSGGAVVGVPRPGTDLDSLGEVYRRHGYRFLTPTLSPYRAPSP